MSLQTPRIGRLLSRQALHTPIRRRAFHRSSRLDVVKPFLLADIGEGITECQLIQWFVQPGARVEHFDKLCEVQSDKASVEITSPFDGVIKKLYYEPDDMAVTGRPLVDIDMDGDEAEAEAEKLGEAETSADKGENTKGNTGSHDTESRPAERRRNGNGKDDFSSLATPAVRHLMKELNVNITDIEGTGRDGRVTKEDVHRFVSQQTQQQSEVESSSTASASTSASTSTPSTATQDQKLPLTPVQTQMFKVMTKSLSIPHFLYSCSADMSSVTSTRKKLNALKMTEKLTHLPFIIKATSLALQQHPLLNSALDTSDPKKPSLTYRSSHNFGVAVDTASGLLVPVIRDVQNLSIAQIAQQLKALSEKARNGKLAPGDFSGASFTISNIGSVGGGVVAPIISEPQVAILGVGRSKVVPAFDENDQLVRREELVLSWSADHRVVDGAECARCAEKVKGLLEEPTAMLLEMR